MRYFFNSALVSLIVVVANVVLNAMAGFALRYSFPGKRLIILTYLSCTMIPFQTTIIPAFLLTKQLGLLNTHFGLALPLMSTIINIFVFKASFDAVPSSLYDAAKIDGMADWKMLFRIFLPLSKAAVGTNIILSFIWSWNNFIWPLIITNSPGKFVLEVGLSSLAHRNAMDYGLQMAGAVFSIIPILAVFLVLRRRFVKGITMTGMKS